MLKETTENTEKVKVKNKNRHFTTLESTEKLLTTENTEKFKVKNKNRYLGT
jgi:hypothetical protein